MKKRKPAPRRAARTKKLARTRIRKARAKPPIVGAQAVLSFGGKPVFADGVIADAWKHIPVLSVNRGKERFPPIHYAPVTTPSGFRGKQALLTGGGYPIDAAILQAWKYRAAPSWKLAA